MSIGFLSFAYKAFSSHREKAEAPTLHSLHPTSHTAHHSEGLTPHAISTLTTTASLFTSESPALLHSASTHAPSPSQLTTPHPYHSLSHPHPLTCLDLQRDLDQAESLCLYASPSAGAVRLFDVPLRRPLEDVPHPHVSAVALVQTSPLSTFQRPSSAYPLWLSASFDALYAHAYHPRRRRYTPHTITLPLAAASDVALSLHPSSLYFALASPTSFALVDLHNLRLLLTLPLPPYPPPPPTSSIALFSPSGRQLALSTSPSLLLYDPLHLPSPTLTLPTPSPLASAAFSPCGHRLALGTSTGGLRVVDLRQVGGQEGAATRDDAQVLFSVQAPHPEGEGEVAPSLRALRFDDSGRYLFAALGADIAVYDTTSWQLIACHTTPAPVTDIGLGRDGRSWVTTDLGGELTLYGDRT